MKNLILAIATTTILFSACNNNPKNTSTTEETTEHEYDATHHHDGDEGEHATTHDGEIKTETTQATTATSDSEYPLASVYDAYFSLTDALTKDDGKNAQSAAKSLYSNIAIADASKMNANEKATWTKYKTKLSFDAEHIKGVDENEHQREHFVSLSKNMYEVMKVIKNEKTVYYQHCPMANNNKGANWLSLNNKISNPYMGKTMLTCGKTVETIK